MKTTKKRGTRTAWPVLHARPARSALSALLLPLILLLILTAFFLTACTYEGGSGTPAKGFSDPEEAARIRASMRYVIHAAGRLEGIDADSTFRAYDGSNSLEGLAQCGEAGARAVELDFNFTADGQLACIHDWYSEYADGIEDGVPLTLDTFRAERIFGNFTPAYIGDAADWLRENEDAVIVTDIKDDNLAGCRAIAEYCPELKNRFVVQIYDESEYDAVRELGFEYIVFTLYRLDWSEKTDWRALGRFAKKHPLIGFTFSYELCSVEGYVDGMLRSGVPLYVHTVNEGEDAYFGMGIAGVYTDVVR